MKPFRKFLKNRKFAIYISLAIVAVLVAFLFAYPYLQNITFVPDREFHVTNPLIDNNTYQATTGLGIKNGTITVEVWVKRTQHNSRGENVIVWDNTGNCNVPYGLGVPQGCVAGPQRFMFTVGAYSNRVLSTSPIENNRWYHVIGVADGSKMRLYIDGRLDNSTTQTSHPTQSNVSLSIGGSDICNCWWNGTIGEVHVYPRALPDSEIREHYQIGVSKYYDGFETVTIKGGGNRQ